MRFQRNFRIGRPFPTGYRAPFTDGVNTDCATFPIGKIDDSVSVPKPLSFPKHIMVKARIIPTPRKGESAFAIFEQPDRELAPYQLYQQSQDMIENNAQWEDIHLVAEESIDSNHKVEKGILLLEKHFLVQRQGTYKVVQRVEGRTIQIRTPQGSISRPVWGYGGYYRLGCSLDQIEQIFFTPVAGKDQTHAHLSPASAWQKDSAGSKMYTPVEEVPDATFRSLATDIDEGKAQMLIQLGNDDTGKSVQKIYRSSFVAKHDPLTEYVYIVFTPS